MKVKTFLNKDFDDLCFDLASKIISDRYEPNIVIGIENGGDVIARKVFEYLSIGKKIKYYSVSTRHKSTNTFEKIHIDRIFKLIPNIILDIIRILHISIYEKLFYWFNYIRDYDINYNIDKELIKEMQHGGNNILIIDDTIDSGKTMEYTLSNFSIKGLSRPKCKENNIKTAVVTVTYKHPLVKPNYQLYNRVIIRFPWAFDVKNNY